MLFQELKYVNLKRHRKNSILRNIFSTTQIFQPEKEECKKPI
jgi:hypothetical protein